jgi:hypothetical protein
MTLQTFNNLLGNDIGKLPNLVEHPVTLFHLYRHWSKSASVWEQINKDAEILSEMIQLAPTNEDCQGNCKRSVFLCPQD